MCDENVIGKPQEARDTWFAYPILTPIRVASQKVRKYGIYFIIALSR